MKPPKLFFIQDYIHLLSDTFYEHYKVPTDSIIPVEGVYERYSRELALKVACNAGNRQCLDDTYVQVSRLVNLKIPLAPGLENVLFCSGLRGTDIEETWVALFWLMQATSDLVFKSRAINALGCTDNQYALLEYLATTLTIFGVGNYTQAEKRAVLDAVLTSHYGLQPVLYFMSEFEVTIIDEMGFADLEAMITIPARTVKNEEQQTMFMNYMMTLDHLPDISFERVANITFENLDRQQEWPYPEIIEIIQRILGNFVPTTVPPTTTTVITTTGIFLPNQCPISGYGNIPHERECDRFECCCSSKLCYSMLVFFQIL